MSRDVAHTVKTVESTKDDANNDATDDADNEPINYQIAPVKSDSESESDDGELVAEDDETSSLGQPFDDVDSGDEMTEDVNPRVIRAARQLQASYNPLANEILGIAEHQTGRDQPYPTRASSRTCA